MKAPQRAPTTENHCKTQRFEMEWKQFLVRGVWSEEGRKEPSEVSSLFL